MKLHLLFDNKAYRDITSDSTFNVQREIHNGTRIMWLDVVKWDVVKFAILDAAVATIPSL